MKHNLQEAAHYIRQHLEKGFSEQQIRQHFAEHGWHSKWIDEAFELMGSDLPDVPKQYRVFRAIKDVFQGIAKNPKAYFSAFGLTFIALVASVVILTALSSSIPDSDEAKTGWWATMLAVLYILLAFGVYLSLTSFFMATSGFALAESKRHRHASINQAFRRAIKFLPRIVSATAIGLIVSFFPYFPLILLAVSMALNGIQVDSVLPIIALEP